MRRALAAIPIALLLLLAAPVAAQDDALIEPTAEQIELSKQAYSAFLAKDWDEAIRLYQEIIDLGPLNFAYASLGFALFKADRCEEARDILDQAESAPKVSNPTPEQVSSLIAQYRGTLAEQCLGSIIVTCPQQGVTLTVDDQPSQLCAGKAIFVTPGPHTLRGELKGKTTEQVVLVGAMSTHAITLEIPGLVEEVIVDPGPDPIPWEIGQLGATGIAVGASGALTLIGALSVELFILGPELEDLRAASASNDLERFDTLKPAVESRQALTQGLLISGVALTLTGATLLIIDFFDGEGAAEPVGLTPWISRDGLGLWRAWAF